MNFCSSCKYRYYGLGEEPCNSCWSVFGGFTKYEKNNSQENKSECNGDYCDLDFSEDLLNDERDQ